MKVIESKNYNLFVHSVDNRKVAKHANLALSMDILGWRGNPILVRRLSTGKLEIIDGAHRFEEARSRGWPIYYIIDDSRKPASPALLSNASKRWTNSNYVESFCAQKKEEYLKLQAFNTEFGLAYSISAMLLSGLNTDSSLIKLGKFKVVNEANARQIMRVTTVALDIGKTWGKSSFFIRALFYIQKYAPDVSFDRIIQKMRSHPGLVVKQVDSESYVKMLEYLYNYKSFDGKHAFAMDVIDKATCAMKRGNPANLKQYKPKQNATPLLPL